MLKIFRQSRRQRALLATFGLLATLAAIAYPLKPPDHAAPPAEDPSSSAAINSVDSAASVSSTNESAETEPDTDKSIDGRVFFCNDGDTCRIQAAQALWMNVRLAGVDAPETRKGRGKNKQKGQPLGEAAQQFLNERLRDRTVRIRQVDLDHYNRPVVEITIKGETRPINLTLLEDGYAEMYRGKTKRIDRAAYDAAEAKAKAQKRGIWSLSDYQSPADYRKSLKNKP